MRGDDGISLAETMTAMALFTVVGAMSAGFLVSQHGTTRRFEDTRQSTNTVRMASDQLSREAREARAVRYGSSGSRLLLWVDTDGDGSAFPGELITWRLDAQADGTVSLLRSTAAAPTAVRTVATGLTPASAFTFDGNPATTRLITITLESDADAQAGSRPARTVSSVRLRNAR